MESIVTTTNMSIDQEIPHLLGSHHPLSRKFEERVNKHESLLNMPLERMGEIEQFKSEWNIESSPVEIAIVGVGGTGGYLVRDLCRFVYSINRRLESSNPDISITLIDGDEVEDKNILRQNYLPKDIGSNKADALASRHARAFGVDVSSIPTMLDSELIKRPQSIFSKRNSKKIIIGCVDNNKARRSIAELTRWVNNDYMMRNSSLYWIDSGNEKMSGQVIVGSQDLMDVTDLYPEILLEKYDSKEEVSCAERLLQDEQNMFVNIMASNLILNYIKSLMLNVPMISNGTVFNIGNVFSSYYIKKRE